MAYTFAISFVRAIREEPSPLLRYHNGIVKKGILKTPTVVTIERAVEPPSSGLPDGASPDNRFQRGPPRLTPSPIARYFKTTRVRILY